MKYLLTIFVAFVAVLGASLAAAAPKAAPSINTDASGLALHGYDPVAYFTGGKPAKGSPAHELEWEGAKWRFESAAALEAFRAAPERYAPQFGGYCAWAVSQHYLAPGDPNYWKIVDGKLYLNANARAKELWEADQPAAIARGHRNWPGVLSRNQDSGGGA